MTEHEYDSRQSIRPLLNTTPYARLRQTAAYVKAHGRTSACEKFVRIETKIKVAMASGRLWSDPLINVAG
jgi:hypothetical protein